MTKHFTLLLCFLISISVYGQQKDHFGGEIVSYQRFGEGLMVTKAKIAPISGIVSNMFFFNRQDEPWNGNVWYEYDWEIRGNFPENGWAQIRVRPEAGEQLKDAPVNVGINEDIGSTLYNYILYRKGNLYVYDVRKDFDINTYDYRNAAAHGGNSASLITGGPRNYTTGGNVKDIPVSKKLDFSLGITAFGTSWTGGFPDGDYEGEFVVDYTRFYEFSGNNLNTYPSWQDEFNGNQFDYSKWQIANWVFRATQFTNNNVRVKDGLLFLKVNRSKESDGNPSSTNLALNGSASQSTTAYGGSAQRAIDNNTNGNWGDKSVTHTANRDNSWWKVDLGQTSEIDRIEIFNRTNCCSDRLSNFEVSVLDDNDKVVWTKYITDTPSPSISINLDSRGKSVRVNLDGFLSLAEVRVFGTADEVTGGSSNLALFGDASQSTTAHGGRASRAIDNNTDGQWRNGSVTHTSNQNDAWWEVDLEENSDIDEIVLFNRTDCCTDRLSNFTVSILNESGTSVFTRTYTNRPTPRLNINTNGITGKRVRVSLNNKNPLSLAEVQVFGVANPNFVSTSNRNAAANYFSLAREEGRKVGLNWATDRTLDPVHFEIEHRAGDSEYELIEVITPLMHRENNVYNYMHDYPVVGDNTYRIKVVYSDYTIVYLDPKTISYVDFQDLRESIIFPNPAADKLFVQLSDFEDMAVKMSLTDLSGRVLSVIDLDSNHLEIEELDMTAFQNGLYVLFIKAPNRRMVTEKITLMRAY